MNRLLSQKVFLFATVLFLLGTVLPKNALANKKPQTHPHYLISLSNLRAARWLIEHHTGNWQETVDEIEAVRRIDAAISEIKKASIDDGKNLQDHPPVDERADHAGRLQLAGEFLEKAKSEINREEDNLFAQGLQARAIGHIDGAIGAVRRAMMAAGPAPSTHPHYLEALSDLRAARWMVEHRPGNWIQSMDEQEAVRRIDAAINAIKNAAIDDGKNIADHPQVDERPDHGGRLHAAYDFLKKARQDVDREEDNNFARGLKALAIEHINAATGAVKRAMEAQNF